MAMKTDDELMGLLGIFNEQNGFSLSDHHDPKRLVRLCIGSGNNFSEISNFGNCKTFQTFQRCFHTQINQ